MSNSPSVVGHLSSVASAATNDQRLTTDNSPLNASSSDPNHSFNNLTHLTAYHSSLGNWLRVLQETYGFRACTIGGLPFMEVSSPITGRRGISLPFTDEVFAVNSQTLRLPNSQIFEAALEHARSRNWKYIELRGSLLNSVACEEPVPGCSYYGHALDLTPGESILFDRLESAVARAIRKAQKAGVEIEIANTEAALSEYYALHCLTRKKHGLPPQSWRFFANIHKHLIAEGQGMVILAKLDKTSIAGALYLHSPLSQSANHASLPSVNSNREALYKFGASDERFQSFRANNLVMWEAIKYYAARGFATLRFGRTDLGHAGLRRFKLSFGTTEYPIHQWRYDLRHERFVTCPNNVTGWHNHLFRAMPVTASRVIGTLLYRHIA